MGRRKVGKKNIIKIDPGAYVHYIKGEAGVGKTSTFVGMYQELYGEDGGLLITIGREQGHDAIANVNFDEAPTYADLVEIIDELVEYRLEDYKNIKVVGLDTVGELFKLVEDEVIRLHNRANPDKKTKSINAAMGGSIQAHVA